MKIGIYYAYWEHEWSCDYLPYIEKVKNLGFDILEVGCARFDTMPEKYFKELGKKAEFYGITLTGGYGPVYEHNLSSSDPNIIQKAFEFYQNIFPKMELANIRSIGGALYSYWPIRTDSTIDKKQDYENSVRQMKKLADMAEYYGISLYMEAVNRFEGYLINTAEEALQYVKDVNKNNVKLLLDTFHMNVEEENLINAFMQAKGYLGEVHVGEPDRRPPCKGRMPWEKIIHILEDENSEIPVVMEPFVSMGGQIGQDIRIWRNIGRTDEGDLDKRAEESVKFLKNLLNHE